MKWLFISVFGVLLLNFQTVRAQQQWCGQNEMTQRYIDSHPEMAPSIQSAKEQLDYETKLATQQRTPRAKKIIPVVFHIIHLNGDENISDLQVQDAIRILNEDYNAQNPDLSTVVSAFQNIIGNVNIEFRLARIDPNGNPTNGIDRIYSSVTNNGGESAKIGGWPRNKYLNIWVVKQWGASIPPSVLAYAYLPSSAHNNPSKDGIIMLSKYVGSIGTSNSNFERTLTHEIGHYLNLEHTWGGSNTPGQSSNCGSDDGVSDTPNCMGSFLCLLTGQSCGSLDNVQNHMDYSSCPSMFTNGQATRMRAALNSTIAQRNQLSTTANLNATGVGQLSKIDFVANRLSICQGESIDFTDLSTYDATGWNWLFAGGQSSNTQSKTPTVTYHLPGIYDVELEATNGSQTISGKKTNYIMVNPRWGNYVPFSENYSSYTQLNSSRWYSYNPDNDSYAYVLDMTTGFDDTKSVKMANFDNPIRTSDELISTTYDLTVYSKVNISFKVAYARKASNDLSKLTLYGSTDCGTTWTSIWLKVGGALASAPNTSSSFKPTNQSQWVTYHISGLPASLMSDKTQFKWEFENRNGNNLYIDNININGTYTNIAQLKAPENGQISRPNNQILYWKAIGGIDSYEYQLDTDSAFNTANLQTGIHQALGLQEGPDTRFETSGLTNGQRYYWRVRLIKNGIAQAWSDTWSFTVAENGVSTQDLLASKYDVKVFPNPIRERSFISFRLNIGANVSITLLDVIGKNHQTIVLQYFSAGKHILPFNSDYMANGVYMLRIQVGSDILHKKIIIHK